MNRLTFYGAAQTVTGSKYLLESHGAKVLVDCGLFQGMKKLREKNWESLPMDVSSIDSVCLTHAHLDHVGYLPRLIKNGFRGQIYCTPATEKIAALILYDSARNQERDAEYANKKGFSKHKPAQPLYDSKNVDKTMKLFHPVPRGKWFEPADQIFMRYADAGHLLGSNMIEVELRAESTPIRMLFSGDVGRYDGPLYFDPSPPTACDYLICESTYGNRDHPEVDLLESLKDVVNRSVKRGGVMLIASFAVGRAQQLIYLLKVLMSEGKIPQLPIYLDSPMSINATKIYREHCDDHDLSEGLLGQRDSVLDGDNVHFTREVSASKALNRVDGPAVIISSSGMMTGGRILHHLKRRLPDPKTTIVLGGFMAAGTRGRRMQDGEKFIRIHGMDIENKAHIEKVSGLSGHADRSDLLRWLKPLPDPKRVFLTHGEMKSATALADTLKKDRGWNVHIPALGETVELS